MSNLEIGYDEHEGKRSRLWWNKFFSLAFISPIFSAVIASVAVAGLWMMMKKSPAEGEVVFSWGIVFFVSLPVVFNAWMWVMRDNSFSEATQ